MNNNILNVRSIFPHMPEEVYNLWLKDRICSNGWPPNGIEWHGFLLGRSVAYWQALSWSKQTIYLSWDKLGALSRHIVEQLVEWNVNGKHNLFTAYIPDSKQRFEQITKYAIEHHNMPGTIVLLRDGQYYEIVDGCHRIAVLIMLQSSPNTKHLMVHPQTVWLAE